MANQGKQRWERAALNAVRHPNSAAAKLYRGRVALADSISTEKQGPQVAYEHLAQVWRRGATAAEVEWGRSYATCSTYCTIMQLTLDVGMDLKKIAAALTAPDLRVDGAVGLCYTWVRPLGERPRLIHCRACGTVIPKS
ncbi:MAG TPA: hypothetical protein VGP24_12940 [Glaciihabitans sp.]|jgi:hypothetical protein|nr:hypothetical protein [Glaciihabitans sp.]